MSTPVLATKLFAPTRRPQLVARSRLIEQLDATLDPGHRLTLLSAPAGFGKTTVLGDWLAHLDQLEDHPRVGWLSLDEGDNDLVRLLTHVIAALRGAGLEVDAAVVQSLQPGSASAALTAIVNDVALAGELTPGERWVLVLDDYHVIRAPEVHEAVTFLLDHLPDQLHLVIATRSDPPLSLPRLRARGQLTEVRAADLRFNTAEAQEFLNQAMGLDLSPADIDALDERTEGWVAGLQLAALSLQGIPEPGEAAAFIEAFTGSNRFVIDYLADEVLARQPAEVRDFLLRTAVLERLTGPLCDAVTGRADGTRMLEELERDNLFVVPLDAERSWYRYHHLFGDVLHARLLAEHADEVPALHQRASAYYESLGLDPDAVRHALAAEDFERAARLVEVGHSELSRTRQDGLLLSWARSLPDSVVRRNPVLSILSGWSSLMAGDLDALEARLDDAEAALAEGAEDPDLAATWADTDALRTAPATISVYRASLAQARGDTDGTVLHARRVMELAGPEDHFLRGAGGGFLGLAAFAAGDVQEALAVFSEAVRSLHAAGRGVDALDSTIVLADMWIAAGRPSRARALFEQALETAIGNGEPYPRATADLHVGLAELDRELDDLSSAEAHLETARVLAERASISENRHRRPVVMAQVYAARGDHDAALGWLEQAQSLYRHGFYPDVRPIEAMVARLQIASGDLEPAATWAEERGLSVDDEPDFLHEYEHLTLARLLLAQHRADSAVQLSERAEPARTAAHGGHGRGPGRQPPGDPGGPGARAPSRRRPAGGRGCPAPGHRRGARAGQLRPAVPGRGRADAGAPAARRQDPAGEMVQEHVRRLLERAQAPLEDAEPQQSLPDPLSQRELEVLRLLDSELTGPQIAQELYVTLNTLRTHTKRIFTKLDVRTRAAAVRRAREHGLL